MSRTAASAPSPPRSTACRRPTANGANAAPGALEEIARLVAAGRLRVPVAASFPVEQIRRAVQLQAGRHVHGKVVVDLRTKTVVTMNAMSSSLIRRGWPAAHRAGSRAIDDTTVM